MQLRRVRLETTTQVGSTLGDPFGLRLRTNADHSSDATVVKTVADILVDVRANGDAAVRKYTEKFDRRTPDQTGSYEIVRADWNARSAHVDPGVDQALRQAAERIAAFHNGQREQAYEHDADGIRVGLEVFPLQRVGLYVPGGSALYPSSVLMTAVPAKVAGVDEVIMVTPSASPEAIRAADIAGVDRIFEVGGAQAVAALAYGTQSIPRVDKIVGPGNQWVAEAKRQVFGAVDIDSIAGPSEVLIIADDDANPAWVAADMLAQAEHDPAAAAILVALSADFVDAVENALASQLASLPRKDIATASLRDHGAAVIVDNLEQAIAVSESFAPEHLELQFTDARKYISRCRSAGAIFIGAYAPEATGDYIAGPNHVLPTSGTARFSSPLGVYDFCKRVSTIEYTQAALQSQRDAIVAIAEVEELHAHARSVAIRCDDD